MVEYIFKKDSISEGEVEKGILDEAVGDLMRNYFFPCSDIIVYMKSFSLMQEKEKSIVVVNPLYKNENLFLLSKNKPSENILFLNNSDIQKVESEKFIYVINKKRNLSFDLNNRLPEYLR